MPKNPASAGFLVDICLDCGIVYVHILNKGIICQNKQNKSDTVYFIGLMVSGLDHIKDLHLLNIRLDEIRLKDISVWLKIIVSRLGSRLSR